MDMVKQVIVVRKDLNMRKGKMAAQSAHASLKVMLDSGSKKSNSTGKKESLVITYDKNSPMYEWINGTFTKVVVSCDSEEELLDLYNQAKSAKLPCSLITDAGKTEFNGVPTKTCIAIGPEESTKIDKITGKLKLI